MAIRPRIVDVRAGGGHRAAMHALLSAALLAACPVLCSSALDAATPQAKPGPLDDLERQRLVSHLEMTESWLTTELDGLTSEQLSYKMSPDSWSIAEVVEHLSIAEPQYWNQLQASAKRPPSDRKPEATDADILWYGIDRTRRTKTGEARVPHDKATAGESLANFRKLRATMLHYARTTADDLRSRILIDGNMDVYQWFLMISAHAQRHILQIREIKAHPGYPVMPRRSSR
jgi:hypothetical protein